MASLPATFAACVRAAVEAASSAGSEGSSDHAIHLGLAVIDSLCALSDPDLNALFESGGFDGRGFINVLIPRTVYSRVNASHKCRQEVEVALRAWRRLYDAVPAMSFPAKRRLMALLRTRKFHRIFMDLIIRLFECTVGPQLTELKNVCDQSHPDGGLATLVFESYDPSGERLVRLLGDIRRYGLQVVRRQELESAPAPPGVCRCGCCCFGLCVCVGAHTRAHMCGCAPPETLAPSPILSPDSSGSSSHPSHAYTDIAHLHASPLLPAPAAPLAPPAVVSPPLPTPVASLQSTPVTLVVSSGPPQPVLHTEPDVVPTLLESVLVKRADGEAGGEKRYEVARTVTAAPVLPPPAPPVRRPFLSLSRARTALSPSGIASAGVALSPVSVSPASGLSGDPEWLSPLHAHGDSEVVYPPLPPPDVHPIPLVEVEYATPLLERDVPIPSPVSVKVVRQPVKVFSDIDDTLFPNYHDVSYPNGTLYPGVLAFYAAVLAGRQELGQPPGQLVFVTARWGGGARLWLRCTLLMCVCVPFSPSQATGHALPHLRIPAGQRWG